MRSAYPWRAQMLAPPLHRLHHCSPTTQGRSSVVIQPAATSTAGSRSSSSYVTKPAETRSVMRPSATSTTSPDTPTAD
jgi:hypothetical protein